ncbi:MAG: ABC transporter substrate-binding protein [Candidatus Dormibacteraeota bacterium]|nr:ABC transporter substrate-binding protein [Candidatus Dormibacteraeota bacterium]
MTVKRAAAMMAALLAGILAVASCGGSTSGGTPAKTTLTVGIIQVPTSLDITSDATASIALMLRDNLYEGLVRADPAGGKVLPELAKSWDESRDGTVWRFHLVTAKWSDGTDFTADDVKFSWDRARDKTTVPANPHPDYFAPIASIAVVDPHTVTVTLKQFSWNWLFHMAQGSAAIVPKSTHLVSAAGAPPATELATKPVGTGPFKLEAYTPNVSLTLTRNDSYWGSQPKLKQVVFRFISDPNAMNNALKSGSIDAIAQVGGPEQLGEFKADANFRVLIGAPGGKVIVGINNLGGPLSDVRVRRALALAVDRKAWIQGVFSGYAVPIGSHSTPNDTEPYYVDTTGVNAYDPAQAKQLLAEAGHATGLTLHLAEITEFPYAVRGGDILASELRAVGVNLQIDTMTFNTWLHTVFLAPQNYELTIINHVEPRDIGNYANPKYYWHYDNPTVAQDLTQADAQLDATQRNALYATVQKQLATDAANIFVMSPEQLDVIRANLKGYPEHRVSTALFLAGTYFG